MFGAVERAPKHRSFIIYRNGVGFFFFLCRRTIRSLKLDFQTFSFQCTLIKLEIDFYEYWISNATEWDFFFQKNKKSEVFFLPGGKIRNANWLAHIKFMRTLFFAVGVEKFEKYIFRKVFQSDLCGCLRRESFSV